MESARRELVCVLLDHIHSLGLVSDFTYSGAMDLVHSSIKLPEFFQYPTGPAKGAGGHECAADTP